METIIEKYLKKPYARILTPAKEGGFAAEILEFPGCFAEGETADEAINELHEAAAEWIEAALNQGQHIPEPSANQGFSGKVALRLPRSIHRQASRMAARDDTSLNQFLVGAIAGRIGAEELCNRLIEKLENRFAFNLHITTQKQVTNNTLNLTFGSPQIMMNLSSATGFTVTSAASLLGSLGLPLWGSTSSKNEEESNG